MFEQNFSFINCKFYNFVRLHIILSMMIDNCSSYEKSYVLKAATIILCYQKSKSKKKKIIHASMFFSKLKFGLPFHEYFFTLSSFFSMVFLNLSMSI